ncbi:hypothetical protein, partial [Microtetraspora malaysiensis]
APDIHPHICTSVPVPVRQSPDVRVDLGEKTSLNLGRLLSHRKLHLICHRSAQARSGQHRHDGKDSRHLGDFANIHAMACSSTFTSLH